MNETVSLRFFNVLERNMRISRVGCLFLYGNPKGYEVSEHIAGNVGVNARIISTWKNGKYI